MSPLMRLRIPSGWVISDNKFCDTEPQCTGPESTFIENAGEGFIPDVLWIQECHFENGRYFIPEQHCFSISLGWTEEARIAGAYYLTLHWVNEEEMVLITDYLSKDRFQVRDRLEHWLELLSTEYAFYRQKMKNGQYTL